METNLGITSLSLPKPSSHSLGTLIEWKREGDDFADVEVSDEFPLAGDIN